MVKQDEEVLFVYSDMQISQSRTANRGIGRGFKAGNVFIGSSMKPYTKIITEDELKGMLALFPDTKIVYKGKIKNVKYVEPTDDWLSGN